MEDNFIKLINKFTIDLSQENDDRKWYYYENEAQIILYLQQ